MASRDSMEIRTLLQKSVILQHVDDLGVAIRIKHLGATAVTSVTLTSATNLVLIDADGTTTSTFSADTTIGAVVDTVNAAANWEAIILDAKRTDASASCILPNSAITASTYDGELYYDCLADISGLDSIAVRLTYSRHTPSVQPVANSHRVRLNEVVYNLTLGGGADTNALKIYEIDGSTETEIHRSTPTTGSETTLWSNRCLYNDNGVTAKDGNSLLVQITDGTSVTGALQVLGNLE